VYALISTDEWNNQKNSLKYHRSENFKFSQREGLRVAQIALTGFYVDGTISERHSGFKDTAKFHSQVGALHVDINSIFS
jgi:hypothetical protein